MSVAQVEYLQVCPPFHKLINQIYLYQTSKLLYEASVRRCAVTDPRIGLFVIGHQIMVFIDLPWFTHISRQ